MEEDNNLSLSTIFYNPIKEKDEDRIIHNWKEDGSPYKGQLQNMPSSYKKYGYEAFYYALKKKVLYDQWIIDSVNNIAIIKDNWYTILKDLCCYLSIAEYITSKTVYKEKAEVISICKSVLDCEFKHVRFPIYNCPVLDYVEVRDLDLFIDRFAIRMTEAIILYKK